MARPNYSFQKRQKDLAKKQKKEEKRQKKAERTKDETEEGAAATAGSEEPLPPEEPLP